MIAKYLIVLVIAAVVGYEQLVLWQMKRRGLQARSFFAAQSAVIGEITRRARSGNVPSQLHHAALLGIGLWIIIGLVSFLFFGK